MAQILADRRDIDFVLFEQLGVERVTQYEKYREFDRKTFNLIINEARQLALKELLPTNAEGDRIGLRFENGMVRVPSCYHRAYELLLKGEWTALTEDPEVGGQGLPVNISQAAMEYLIGANYCLVKYGTMGHGTGKMISLFGTQSQKDLFVRKLYTGRWGGTMLLTEANAGTDVGALTTTAVRNEDGTYTITGNKIFITNGEHDLCENIIHPVLARVEGAPEGARGISIFIVPKVWVNPDGALGCDNDVVCTGIEEKLGIHSSATCSIALGGRGKCRGWLLGEENQGMRIMFHMMNEARLSVGFQAFTYGSAAYLYALNYAKERLQGKELEKGGNGAAGQVPIIRHPDVRRMLMWMKSHVEGMRSFIYFTGMCVEESQSAQTAEERSRYADFVAFLTPIVKAYCSQRGFDICVQAMQVYGGYGYIREYPIEQLLRDSKITSIFEGTDGIQAMDLLGRKLWMKEGAVFRHFLGQVCQTVSQARQLLELCKLADELEDAATRLSVIARHLGELAGSGRLKKAFAFAFPFLESCGDIITAWMLLWRAITATKALENGAQKKDMSFYEGKVKTADFFIATVLPVSIGRLSAIEKCSASAIEIPENAF